MDTRELSSLAPFLLSPESVKPLPFVQIKTPVGAGARRLLFEYLPRASQIIWMMPEWRLYAPALWTLAAQKNIQLTGIDLEGQAPRRRFVLWRELAEAQVFDVWVIDSFSLKAADGHYLQRLFRKFSPPQVWILQPEPLGFCRKRAAINMSSHRTWLYWNSGETQHYPSPLGEILGTKS